MNNYNNTFYEINRNKIQSENFQLINVKNRIVSKEIRNDDLKTNEIKERKEKKWKKEAVERKQEENGIIAAHSKRTVTRAATAAIRRRRRLQ